MSWSRIEDGASLAPKLLLTALFVLTLAAAAGCGEDAVTRPAVREASLDGEWSGSGSLYRELSWSLTQHAGGDSITGEGFMDAPGFLDGFPRGEVPRYRIRGVRRGLFVDLQLLPLDEGARALDVRGVVERAGEVRAEVFLRGHRSRLDVIRVFLRPADRADGGG